MAELQYPTFEANQVLTEKHLNQLREYVQAEDHQTRVHGIGVGILGGLEVSVGRGADDRINRIEISCGAGITTAGYLVQIDSCELTHYRTFADADPHRYGLLWTDDDPPEIKGGIWELREGDDDGQSTSLSAPSAVEDLGNLGDLGVVLYAECREEQIDACNLEDCDDKGADVRIDVRKLLVRTDILPEIDLPFGSGKLKPLRLERPADFTEVDDLPLDSFANVYKELFERALPPIASALATTWWKFREILEVVDRHWIAGPIFENAADGEARIESALGVLRDSTPDEKIQLFYNFLRDIIATHNAFVSCAAGLKNWGCVNENDFPRHLALSELPPPPKTDSPIWRHAFRPLLATVCQESIVYKLRRLFKKIDLAGVLYDPEKTAVDAAKIRPQLHIEPSANLIPYYYGSANGEDFDQLEECWDAEDDPTSAVENLIWTFDEVKQPPSPSAEDREDNPVLLNLDDQEFLRIEGHLGQTEAEARLRIENLRTTYNLAFDVVSVRLGNPGSVSFADLCDYREHRARYDEARHVLVWRVRQLHAYLDHLRSGMADARIGWLRYVSPDFPIEPTSAVLNAQTSWMGAIPPTLEDFVEGNFRESHTRLLESAYGLLAALHDYAEEITAKPYHSFHHLNDVDKSDAPYSILIALVICQIRAQVLRIFNELDVNMLLRAWSWAGGARAAWTQNNPETLLGFVQLHPGIEHAAGTTKNGTFILVHDGNTVVGDFFLPYRCCERPCQRVDPPSFEECVDIYLESEYRDELEILDLEAVREKSGQLVEFRDVSVSVGEERGTLTRSNTKWWPFRGATTVDSVELKIPEDPDRWPRLVLRKPSGWIRRKGQDIGSRVIDLVINRGRGGVLDGSPCHLRVWPHLHPPIAIASDLTAVTVMGKPVTIDLLADSLLPDDSFQVDVIVPPEHGDFVPDEMSEAGIPSRTGTYSPRGKFVGRDHFDFEVSSRWEDRRLVSCGRVTVHVADCCDLEAPPEDEPSKPDIYIPREYFCVDDGTKYYITTRGAVTNVWGPGVFSEVRGRTSPGSFQEVVIRSAEADLELVEPDVRPPVPRPPVVADVPLLSTGAGTIGIGDSTYPLRENLIGRFLREREDLAWITAETELRARYYIIPNKAGVEGESIEIGYSYMEGDEEKKDVKEVFLVPRLPAEFNHEEIEINDAERTIILEFFAPAGADDLQYHWDFGENAVPRESTKRQQQVEFDLGKIGQLLVQLSLWYERFPRCDWVIVREIPISMPAPQLLVEKYTEVGLRWELILDGRPEVLTDEEIARLEAAAEHLPFVRELVTVEGGAEKYGKGDFDPLVLEHESRQLEATTKLVQTKYEELRQREEAEGAPAGEYTKQVEPLVELARTQLEGGLSYVKHKNRAVNDSDVRYINAAGHSLAALKELGVEIDTDGKTTALLREMAEGVQETTFLNQLNELQKIVEAS